MDQINMDVGCAVIELKPHSKKKVADWAKFMNEHKAEALDMLRSEGIVIDSAFFVTIENRDYLIGYTRAVSDGKKREPIKSSSVEVDQYHQAFKQDVWERLFEAKLLTDLSRVGDEGKFV